MDARDELLRAFREEAAEHLAALDAAIVAWEKGAAGMGVFQDVLRRLHNLKGAAHLAGAGGVERLAHALEGALSLAQSGRLRPDEKTADVLLGGLDAVREVLTRLATGRPRGGEAAVKRLEALAPAEDGGEADPEMAALREQFIAESLESLDEFSRLAVALETRSGDASLIRELFRRAHSLKGSGTTYGLPPVSRVSHKAESLLAALRDGKLKAGPAVVDALLKAADALKELFQQARAGTLRPDQPLPVLIELEAALSPSGPAVPLSGAGELKVHVGESIRVRMDRLDALVQRASEMVVARTTREAAVKSVEERAAQALALAGRWERLREGMRRQGVLEALRRAGLLEDFDRLGPLLGGLQAELEGLLNRFSSSTSRAGALVEEIQDDLLRIRMVPVSLLFDSAPRLVRELTRDRLKEVRLETVGSGTVVDKRVLESMADPLMHLLRNAVDHGIESPSERRKLGKAPAGLIEIKAESRGNQILITVRDDGRGMDPRRLASKAAEKGLVTPGEAKGLAPEQALAFIFYPGFSTKTEVTEISGRGVGMDVVKTNVEALGGYIETWSEVGRGTAFTIRLPLSLAVLHAVRVEAAGQTFYLPADSVAVIARLVDSDIRTEGERVSLLHRDRRVPVVSLAGVLGLKSEADARFLLIVQATQGALAFSVDSVLQDETVLLKELGELLGRVPMIAGGTFLPDGRVAVVLDAAGLIAAGLRRVSRS